MKIFSELQKLSQHLQKWKGAWALCGGVAASLYRDTPRFTADIDVAIIAQGNLSAEEIAQQVLAQMQYPSLIGFVPGLTPQEKQSRALISTRHEQTDTYVGIDFLLPVFPWVPHAVERAQANLVDYGFAKLPTITIEDLLLSKFSALAGPEERFQDKDDVLSLMKQLPNIDTDYLLRRIRELNLRVPSWVELSR